MNSSEDIKTVHGEIMAFLPPESFVVVEHSYRNYSEYGDTESWCVQAYPCDQFPQEVMFIISNADKEALIANAKIMYDSYCAESVDDKIAKLESQLEKLRGRK